MRYSYNSFSEDMYSLKRQIKDSQWIPQIIVGVSRGGLIPGVCLSHEFDAKFVPLVWSTRDYAERHLPTIETLLNIYSPMLIVDDIIDTGITMAEIEQAMKPNPFVKYASLLYNPVQKQCIPHYWARKIDRDLTNEWVNFWWENTDVN